MVTEQLQSELIGQLKTEVHNSPDLTVIDDEQLRQLIARTLEEKIQWAGRNRPEAYRELASLNFREKRYIINAVYEAIRGLGVLGQIISDPDITEVMINGFEDIFVERAGRLQKLENHFESHQELETIITKFVSQSGRAVNESEPIVDTHLEDGSRVNVVMPPVALNGPIVTIRRFPKEAMTVQKLIRYGSITPEVAEVLELLVRSRYNIFVSGGTGSGKTTFLNALSNFIPRDERIITIEDSAELQIRNVDNLVRLETRNAGPDGSGAITIKDLIKSALRMRPDRIVVGEVRGAEALDMLQAMNTGHDGSLSTGHANSTRDMLSRLETMVLQGAASLPLEAIRQQIGSAVDIVIHLSRLRDKSRKTMEIVEILGYDQATRDYKLNVLYQFQELPQSTKEKVVGQLTRTGNPMKNIYKLENAGIYREI
jgi:pilus assembly protein CpaF